MKQYIVLIGDLVGSKKLGKKDREKYQLVLSNVISRINESSDSIISPLTITLGDEFQAVYDDMAALLADSWSIMAELHPVRVRFSIGIGEIYTPINSDQALGMDGPAFHSARDGMEEMKESGSSYSISLGSVEKQPEASKPLVALVKHSLMFISSEVENWKKTRFRVLTMLNDGLPVKEIAGKIGISESAVYKNREEGHLNLFLDIKDSIGENINRIL